MSAQPARPDNVRPLETQTVPYDRFQTVADAAMEAQDEVKALKDALVKSHREVGKLKGEIRRMLEEYADGDDVKEFLERWRLFTGRSVRTDVTPGSDRANHYRKLRKKRSRFQVGAMVIGARHHHFPPFRKRDDMEDFAKSTKWAEECLEIGLKVIAEQEKQA